MKWKQILAIVLISASTTGVTMWGVKYFSHDGTYVYQKDGDTGKIPANYAGFNGVNGSSGPADFSAAAEAAIPATVHIKTKATRTVSNNLPRNTHSAICSPTWMISLAMEPALYRKWLPAPAPSSAK